MKILVRICSGTACYILGGAKLLTLQDYLTEEELKEVVIEGSPCMGFCKEYNSNTPYATINDEIISGANIEVLVDKIKDIIKNYES